MPNPSLGKGEPRRARRAATSAALVLALALPACSAASLALAPEDLEPSDAAPAARAAERRDPPEPARASPDPLPAASAPAGLDSAEARLAELLAGGGRDALAALAPGASPAERLLYGLAQLHLERPERARPHLEAVLVSDPEAVAALIALARVELVAGNAAEAEQRARRAAAALHARGATRDDIGLLLGDCQLAGADPEAGVHALRAEVASGPRPVAAALHLVDFFGSNERLPEALAALDAGLVRAPDSVELALARPRVLMDLGLYAEATAALLALYEQHPHPSLLFTAAAAERAQGHAAAARAHLRALQERFAAHAWVAQHQAELTAMTGELAAAREGATDYSERELLSMLRGATDAVQRVRALRTLVAAKSAQVPVALRIALADPAAVVRADALRAAFAFAEDRKSIAAAGLADPVPALRGLGVRLASELPRDEAIPLLLSVLDTEEDGYVLGRMHSALNALTGDHAALPAVLDSAAVDRMRAYWRQRCPQ